MNRSHSALFPLLLLASTTVAQGPHFLFSITNAQQTLSGSGGTVLELIRSNEVASIEFGTTPCATLSAEKWAPRTMFQTQAGDADGDDDIWEGGGLFGRIDAVLQGHPASPVGLVDQRTLFYSVQQPMDTVVSGVVDPFRPGDVARIIRDSAGDEGQIEYFLRAEDLQSSLGLPVSPLFVNLDACAWEYQRGVFFSIEETQFCDLVSTGPTVVRDGDILCIPAGAITWNPSNLTVSSVIPGSAVVVYNEPAVSAMVANANVTDRFGACVNTIGDVDALEIDFASPLAFAFPSAFGPVQVPHLLFAGETLTGASVLNTLAGGSIHNSPCGPLGTSCGGGATLGEQMGLAPPTALIGVQASLNGLAATYICRFVTEAQQPQIPVWSSIDLDIGSPAGAALNWILIYPGPGGPGAVAPSQPFPWGFLCYPDYFALPVIIAGPFVPTGFDTWSSGPIPFAADLVLQSVTIMGGGAIEISTPTTVEVF